MKIFATAAALLLAGAAHAQTPQAQTPAPQAAPAPPVSSLTRDLNSGPPAPAVYLAPPPEPVIAPPPASAATGGTPTPRPAATTAGASAPTPSPAPPARVVAAPTPTPTPAPVIASPPRPAPIPVTPSPSPRAAPITPPAVVPVPRTEPLAAPPAVAAAPVEAPAVTPPPAAPAPTVLDSAARAALPFTADLPPGFEIVTGRPGPDFRIYTIRRAGQSFVMVYAGPASQFPIYSGQMVEAAGRASILSTEDGVRHAVEHLFQRTAAPREIHVWTMSLDGADRDLAEQIAQSVDVR